MASKTTEPDLSTILAAAQTEADLDQGADVSGDGVQGTVVAAVVDPKAPGELSRFAPGSKALESLLSAGYGMDRQQAETIIRERTKNPALYPYEVFRKAQAFLEALNASPVAVATNPGWTRSAE